MGTYFVKIVLSLKLASPMTLCGMGAIAVESVFKAQISHKSEICFILNVAKFPDKSQPNSESD
ncbi:hypothetical protein [Anabaena sp. CS-542/02]|uniref:hypothetical protein n=1 Tax=Anabaena sp. CS-542/02 TaxID=3021719 RepID=UPI00232B7B86|nr:hypothetical protein [Anabaena sp. CS-542/02]MDB9445712.1 hypothetical protein [Anabaena sp. CS-542/02]